MYINKNYVNLIFYDFMILYKSNLKKLEHNS